MAKDEKRIITFNDDFRLVQDDCCCWIERHRTGTTKDGKEKEYWERYTGYHSNYENLMESFMNHRFRDVDADTVREALRQMNKIKREIESFIKLLK